MNKGKYVAYYRVSTARQGRSGLGLEAQRHAVSEFLSGRHWELIAEFVEIESGRRDDRTELARALAACRLEGATLVIAKLDRLSRNAAFLLRLRDENVEFVAADMPEANRLTVGILAMVAENEAEAISARTKAALAAAKRRGVRLGRPEHLNGSGVRRKGAAASAKARRARANQRATDLATTIDELRARGATSLRELARALNERTNYRTTRGLLWHAVQVQRLLARIDNGDGRN